MHKSQPLQASTLITRVPRESVAVLLIVPPPFLRHGRVPTPNTQYCGRHRSRPEARFCWPRHADCGRVAGRPRPQRSEEHTSELPSLMRISYAVFCLKKNTKSTNNT